MSTRLPIFYLEFPTQHLVASTFLRFQEHYESPRFAGKLFSWETYMDWYATQKGNFSYTLDWSGFNIPSWVLTPFRSGSFGRLALKERALLKVLPATGRPFYVIASSKEADGDVMAHEIVHGYFHVFPAYAEKVRATIESWKDPYVTDALGVLSAMGYGDNVLEDELNAYLTTGLCESLKAFRRPLKGLCGALIAAFHETFDIDLADPEVGARLMRSIVCIPYSRFDRELRAMREACGDGF